MSTVRPNVQSLQDMPPPGGYKFDPLLPRRVRPRGPSGFAIFAAVGLATIYGYYQIGVTNDKKRLNHKETRECRMAIWPYLRAEDDFKRHQDYLDELAYEAEVMKNRPDWEVGKKTYSKRYIPPRTELERIPLN